MKIRSAAGGALALLIALGGAACGNKDNANNSNNSNSARNTNAAPAATATPASTPTPSASEDGAIRNKTEAALSKAGVTGVTVDVKEGTVTLKGDVPKAKWPAALQAAHESGAKKVENQLNDKK